MANSVITVTTTSQVLVSPTTKIGTLIATNTWANPIYIRYSEAWPAVAWEWVALLFNGSSCAIQQPTNNAVSVISSWGSSTLSYYYQ